ncbi:hypothetical protein C7S16_2731 [Burkholderia thailandensis]|uniref:Uncharacterized protein n=1 Tax=Burkholderia thailandensis TaxID=57975 RepID=A0AAW9D4S2_BURTH|nr:hypothetical protein [Burkholderia thailandensis]
MARTKSREGVRTAAMRAGRHDGIAVPRRRRTRAGNANGGAMTGGAPARRSSAR